jgi:hypothetical protein
LEKKKYVCSNTSCKKTFDTAKTITYQACPFCSTKLEEEEQNKDGCFYYFGYLSERETGEPIPIECIECMKSIECMLNTVSSQYAAKEIQKWYKV